MLFGVLAASLCVLLCIKQIPDTDEITMLEKSLLRMSLPLFCGQGVIFGSVTGKVWDVSEARLRSLLPAIPRPQTSAVGTARGRNPTPNHNPGQRTGRSQGSRGISDKIYL